MGDAAPFGKGKVRRLFGLDRSGAEPEPTRAGQPLRPFTIPNFIGYLRLLGIPLFLWVAFSSGDGRDWTAAVLFFLIAGGDYVDGFLARVTGQYSRLGALMDPVIDRLTIFSGLMVCWHFDLLPHWMLALLLVRELATLMLARWGLSHGVDIEVNWFGRVAVFPVMTSLCFAMFWDSWVPTALLAIGIVLGVIATYLYARVGRDQIHASQAAAAAEESAQQ
ncbi:MAG: CDP-alcohol phosphatidyltransferase family protein [Actinomycetota bacterium]|jgi:cardiolipin synthase|nr:CDP-alcohol phosphatidyltransferase family protein [Actinomycetota bacterium]